LQTLFSAENKGAKVRAIPGEGLDVPIWILGSSTDSAHLAAAMGLPYAFASHFAPTYFTEAIRIYRENFKPSKHLDKPYVLACVNVVAADTDEEARFLASSVQQLFIGIVTGRRKLLQPPVDMSTIWGPQEEAAVKQMLAYSFIGGPDKIKGEVASFLQRTGVDEIMATSHIYDHAARLRSYEIFAQVMQQVG
jgi:luciferase family oxidoreductase group 1